MKPGAAETDLSDFDKVHEEMRGELRRYVQSLCRDAEEAADIVQETFIKLAKSAAWAERRVTRGYVYKIATNIFVDRHRSLRQRREREHKWAETQHPDGIGPDMADRFDPERIVAGRQELKHIAAHISKLPSNVRTALMLHRVNGLSHREIAAQLGVSRSAVEKYIIEATRYLYQTSRRQKG